MKVRIGKVVGGTTTWGDWTTCNYIYQTAAKVDSRLDSWNIVKNSSGGFPGYPTAGPTHTISGHVTFGNNSVMTSVEIDYTGDGVADGYAMPNADGDFVFHLTPTTNRMRLRIVETLADGTKHYPTTDWKTLAVAIPNSNSSSGVALVAVTGAERETSDAVLRVTGTTSSHMVYIDLTGNGTTSFYITPDANGRITRSMIDAAMRQHGYTPNSAKLDNLPSGLLVGSAWITSGSSSTTRHSETVLTWINGNGLSATEYSAAKAQEDGLLAVLEEYQESLLGAIKASQNNETPVTQYNTLENGGTSSSTTGQITPGVTAADRDRILNTAIPSIPMPNFGGELFDLSKDPVWKDAVKVINDAYRSAVHTAQNAFRAGFDVEMAAYEKAVGKAWQDYAKDYEKLLNEYNKIKNESFSETQECKDINTAHSQKNSALSAQKTAELATEDANYNSARQALTAASTAAKNAAEAAIRANCGCPNTGHTKACNRAVSAARTAIDNEYAFKYLKLLFDTEEAKAKIEAGHEERLQSEIARYSKAMATARTAFETGKVNRMLAKVESMATARKVYEIAVADATKTALTNLAPKVEIYRKAVATAWGNAVTAQYNKLVEVVTHWKNTAGTDGDWANYVLTLVNNAKAEAAVLVTAYQANVSANAAAEKTAMIAQANAAHAASTSLANLRESASKSAAQRSATLQNEKWTVQKTFEVELAEQKLTTAQQEIALWRTMTASQLSSMRSYKNDHLTRSHANSAAGTALYHSYDDGHISQSEYNTQTQKLSWEYGIATDVAGLNQEKTWQADYLAYHLAMQECQRTYAKTSAKLYETYENKLTDALATYWTASINVGVSQETTLASLTNTYIAALNAASDAFSDSVTTAGQSFDTSALAAAETRTGADNTADTNRINNVMTAFISAASTAYNSVAGAVGTWLTSNLTASQNWFNSEMTGVTSLIVGLVNTAVSGITDGLNRGYGLVDGVLGAVGTLVGSLNASAANINTQALTKSKELSLSEIDARVDYYKAVSKAEREAKESKIETNTKKNIQEINYVYAIAMGRVDQNINTVLATPNNGYYYSGYYHSYGVFCDPGATNFYQNVQIAYGNYGYESGYFADTYNYGYNYYYYNYYYYYSDYYYGGNGKYNYPVASKSNGYGYDPTVYFGIFPTYYSPVYGSKAGTSTELQPVRGGISAAAGLKNFATDATLDYNKAVAAYDYTVAYTGLYRAAEVEGWSLGGISLGASIASSTAFCGDLWDECATVNTSLFGSARGDDTLSQLLGASSSELEAGMTLDTTKASNFGQYQINWRQQANTGAADVAWATNVKSARDSYFTALGGATTTFDDTLTGAIDTYYDTMLEAQITRSQSHFDASHTRYNALESAMNDYSLASFNAAKEAATKYLESAVKEVTDNAKAVKDVREREKNHYEGIALPHEAELVSIYEQYAGPVCTNMMYIPDQNAYDDLMSRLAGAANSAKAANTAVVNAKASRDTAANNAINNAKKENENKRKETDKATETEYRNTENNHWNTYYAAAIAADSAYMKAYKQAEQAFNTAKKNADDAYETAIIPAWLTYSQQLREYETLYLTAIAHAGDANFNVANFFNNGMSGNQGDYQLVMATCQSGPGLPLPPISVIPEGGRAFRELLADSLRWLLGKKVEVAEMAASKTGSPLIVGGASFAVNAEKNVGGMFVGLLEPEILVEGKIEDIKQSIEVGNEHGFLVGMARQSGMLPIAETLYGYDIMTLEQADPFQKIAEAGGRIGETSAIVAGGIWSGGRIRGAFKPTPTPATTIAENISKTTGKGIIDYGSSIDVFIPVAPEATFSQTAIATSQAAQRAYLKALFNHPENINAVIAQNAETFAQNALRSLQKQAGEQSHFYSRHGAQTTLQQQLQRAQTGMTPDGFQRSPMDASRFMSHQTQLEAYNRAMQLSNNSSTQTFQMNHISGEGFLKGGTGPLRTTKKVTVFFDKNGNIISIFPDIR